MIIVTTRINVAMGRMSEGLDWAERIIKAMTEGDSAPQKWWLLRQIAVNPNTFAFAGQYASMGEYEKQMNKFGADPAYQALIKEMGERDWALGNERTIAQVIDEG